MGYEKSKIYKLQCASGHFYIGSTSNTFAKRLGQHKDLSKKTPDRRVYKHINGDWSQVRMILIEEFPCETKEQLKKREDEYIQRELKNPLCLNSVAAIGLTKEQTVEYQRKYREAHRDKRKEKAREYYLAHREKMIADNTAYRLKRKNKDGIIND